MKLILKIRHTLSPKNYLRTVMASISHNFKELTFSSSDLNPECSICWEQGSPKRSLFDIHTASLPQSTKHHLACRTCIVRWLTIDDLLLQKVFSCHICRKDIPVDPTSAKALGIPNYQLPLEIFHFTCTEQTITPTMRSLEHLCRKMREEPDSPAQARLQRLDAVTRRLLQTSFK